MKKLYLATVCFLPIATIPLFYAVFIAHVAFPSSAFPVIEAYFFLGFIFVMIDLWRSRLGTGAKVMWTVLNCTVGLISLAVYWFVVVLRQRPNQSLQHNARDLA